MRLDSAQLLASNADLLAIKGKYRASLQVKTPNAKSEHSHSQSLSFGYATGYLRDHEPIFNSKSGPLGQAKRSRTKVLPEDAILLPEIVDEIFLLAIHLASQGQHEEVQSVGHGLRLRGADTAVTHVVSGIHSPQPFSRTMQGLQRR